MNCYIIFFSGIDARRRRHNAYKSELRRCRPKWYMLLKISNRDFKIGYFFSSASLLNRRHGSNQKNIYPYVLLVEKFYFDYVILTFFAYC